MARCTHEDLLAVFRGLQHAVAHHERLEARLRAGEHGPSLLDRSLQAAEDVVAARTGLYRALMRCGWTPPDDVVVELVHDERLLATYDGAVHG